MSQLATIAYVVVWGHCGDCGQIQGIFSRRETADAYAKELGSRPLYALEEFHVEVWEMKD